MGVYEAGENVGYVNVGSSRVLLFYLSATPRSQHKGIVLIGMFLWPILVCRFSVLRSGDFIFLVHGLIFGSGTMPNSEIGQMFGSQSSQLLTP